MIQLSSQKSSPAQMVDSGKSSSSAQGASSERTQVMLHTALLGVFFLLLTLTYSSFSTIITHIYQQQPGYEYLGPLLLVVNYGTFMVVNIFASFVVVSYKRQLLFGAVTYTLNYVVQIPELMNGFGITMLVLTSVLSGTGAAIVWVSQGGSMMAILEYFQIPLDQKGRYFGVLNMITFMNIVLGSIVTTFALGFFSNSVYFLILSILGGLSVLYCVLVLKDFQNLIQQKYTVFRDEAETLQIESLNGKEHLGQRKWKIFHPDTEIVKSAVKMLAFLKTMRNFVPLIFIDGTILAFISASATHLLPEDQNTSLNAGIFLIFLGTGAIIGGYFSGYLSDKFPIIKVGKSTLLLLGIVIALELPIYFQMVDSLGYAYFLGFSWGVCWHFMDGWLWVVCGKVFNGRLESFALQKLIHSLSFVLYQICLLIYGSQNEFAFIEGYQILLVLSMGVCLYFLIRAEKQMILHQN